MKIDLKLDTTKVDALLKRLQQAGINPRPALALIGERLLDSTKQRFRTGLAPDGTPWAPNTFATLQSYLSRFSGNYSKDGRLNARGAGRAAGKRPLIGETRSLSATINYRLDGNTAVEIGSPMEYAAVQQLGAKKGAFGTTRRGAPIPWGDIPARPFLGVSPADQAEIEQVLADFLADQTT